MQETFENRFMTLIGVNYDFDKELLPPDVAQSAIALIREMPDFQCSTSGQITTYKGWCEEESTYCDLKVNDLTGHGFHAFVGSENLMIESDDDAAIYKAAFEADVNSTPGK